jgi:hypothetical protein
MLDTNGLTYAILSIKERECPAGSLGTKLLQHGVFFKGAV